MNIIVWLHNNPAYAKALVSILPEGVNPRLIDKIVDIGEAKLGSDSIRIEEGGKRYGHGTWAGYNSAPMWREHAMFDMATDFGKIVGELQPEVTVEKVTADYDAVVRRDKSGADVGCQFVSKAKVEELWRALQ